MPKHQTADEEEEEMEESKADQELLRRRKQQIQRWDTAATKIQVIHSSIIIMFINAVGMLRE